MYEVEMMLKIIRSFLRIRVDIQIQSIAPWSGAVERCESCARG
jgi:hypothetical protein